MITAVVKHIGPVIKVKVFANGIVEPTNPVVIGPTRFNNTILDIDEVIQETKIYANNVAANAYANAVMDDVDFPIDAGEF